MKKFIVEFTLAYEFEAESGDEAADLFLGSTNSELEEAHKKADYWAEVSGVYEKEGE